MLLPSGVSNVPTPNVRSNVWDHVESYTICMLLAYRLKIISSPNLQLIISFLALPLVLLCHYQSLSFVASMRLPQLTSRVYLRLAIRPSAQFVNLLTRTTSNDWDWYCLSSSQGKVLVARVSVMAHLEHKAPSFFPTIFSTQETKKSYYQQATYKDQIPMVSQQIAAFLFQESYHLNAIITTRSTYNDRGSGPKNVIFSNGPQIISECSNSLY
jgi:hypothetical protein